MDSRFRHMAVRDELRRPSGGRGERGAKARSAVTVIVGGTEERGLFS